MASSGRTSSDNLQGWAVTPTPQGPLQLFAGGCYFYHWWQNNHWQSSISTEAITFNIFFYLLICQAYKSPHIVLLGHKSTYGTQDSKNKHYPRGWKREGWKMSRRMFLHICTETLHPILLQMIPTGSMFRKAYRGFHQHKASTACISSSPQQFQRCCNLSLTLIIKGRFTVSSFFNTGRLTQPDLASKCCCNKLPSGHWETLPDTAKAAVLIQC